MKYICLKCNHQWLSRLEKKKPCKCPKCQNPNWEKPRRLKNGK